MVAILRCTQDARWVMLACFVSAACLAVGHHCFYQNLQGHRVDQQSLTQNQNIYVGTAFTFLVKAFLSAAVLAAYNQVLWRRLLGHDSRIAYIDSLSALVSSPAALDDWRLLHNFPLLVVLAVVAWTVAFVAVVPPGTLSVVTDTTYPTSSSLAPTLDFTLPLVQDNNFRSTGRDGVNLSSSGLDGFNFAAAPLPVASALAIVTALTGELPQIQNARTNSSYTISFPGPALKCTTTQVTRGRAYCSSDRELDLSYLSFLTYPQDTGPSFGNYFDLNASVPLGADGNISCDSITNYRTSIFGPQPPQLFVVAQTSYEDVAAGLDTPKIGWNASTCQLGNATYKIDVEISAQSVQRVQAAVSEFKLLDSTPSYIAGFNTSDVELTGPSANKIYNYLSIMSLMGQLTVGTVNSASGGSTLSATLGGLQNTAPAPFPNIFGTRLAGSPEIQAFMQSGGSAYLSSLKSSSSPSAASTPPLAQQLEDLFTNMTLALLTSAGTSSNASTSVQYWEPHNLYAYNAQHLWFSYGVGLLVTGLVVALGYVTVLRNGASYSTKFSTFLCTVPWSRVDELLGARTNVRGGGDPAPKDVVNARLMLGDGRGNEGVELLDDSRMLKGNRGGMHDLHD